MSSFITAVIGRDEPKPMLKACDSRGRRKEEDGKVVTAVNMDESIGGNAHGKGSRA